MYTDNMLDGFVKCIVITLVITFCSGWLVIEGLIKLVNYMSSHLTWI